MRTLYLHVGRGKTGTSSIQEFLWGRSANLAGAGLQYPAPPSWTGEFLDAKANGLWLLSVTRQANDAVGEAVAAVNMAEFSKWIAGFSQDHDSVVSCEGFWGISEETLSAMAEEIRRHAFQPVIILYLREQFGFLKSWYGQVVRKGRVEDSFAMLTAKALDISRSFPDADPSNYEAAIGRFARVFGEQSLRVVLFGRSESQRGPLGDMLDILGINPALGESQPRLNEGFGLLEIECARYMRKRRLGVSLGRLASVARKHGYPRRSDFEVLVPQALVEDFRSQYVATNERVRALYFPEREALFDLQDNHAVGCPPDPEDLVGLCVEYIRRYPHLVASSRERTAASDAPSLSGGEVGQGESEIGGAGR